MRNIDGMSPAMRALVAEYGYVIVQGMIDDGYRHARDLEPILVTWRQRRQEQWLASDYVTAKTIASIVNAAVYRNPERNRL